MRTRSSYDPLDRGRKQFRGFSPSWQAFGRRAGTGGEVRTILWTFDQVTKCRGQRRNIIRRNQEACRLQ